MLPPPAARSVFSSPRALRAPGHLFAIAAATIRILAMRCARVALLASIAAGLAVALAGSASAYPLIDSSGRTITYDNGLGTSGTITYLGFETAGAVTGIVDTWGTIYYTDIVLLFKATPAVGVIDSIIVGLPEFCDPGPYSGNQFTECTTAYDIRFPTGAGWGPDGAPDTSFVDIATVGPGSEFLFADGPDAGTQGDLGPGEVSDRFFVAYTPGDITFNGKTTLSFIVHPETGDFFSTRVTLVPEPSTLLLLGAGLGAIAIATPRRLPPLAPRISDQG